MRLGTVDYTFEDLTTDELRDQIVDYLGRQPASQDDNEWCNAAIREFRKRTEPAREETDG